MYTDDEERTGLPLKTFILSFILISLDLMVILRLEEMKKKDKIL